MRLPVLRTMVRTTLTTIKNNLGTAVLVLITVLVAASVGWYVVRPAYVSTANHTYTSRLGYPAVLRMRGQPFPVTTARVVERTIKRQYLGEGLIESEPVRVPIVPRGRIARVYVNEGDYVKQGQLLAELDPQLQEIKIAQAKTALEVARNELERARVGSPYNMAMERPEMVASQLEAARQQVTITSQLVEMYKRLEKQRIIPKETLLQQQLVEIQAKHALRLAEQSTKISQGGRPLSVQVAEMGVREAELKHKLYTQEFQDFKIHAVADGLVAQVLVHEGEYNQNPGTSAFVLAVGRWFGGNFDQTTIGRFGEGSRVNVRLEAFPGRTFDARVEKVKAMVTYNPGGPEAARPVRPLGTGSPEWPATFETRIRLVGSEESLRDVVPGLTGFAEVAVERRTTAVPQGSVTSMSAGSGVAYVVEGDRFRVQPVVVGQQTNSWIEITSGLKPGMEIIADGYQVLSPGDQIATSPARPPETRPTDEPEDFSRPSGPPRDKESQDLVQEGRGPQPASGTKAVSSQRSAG